VSRAFYIFCENCVGPGRGELAQRQQEQRHWPRFLRLACTTPSMGFSCRLRPHRVRKTNLTASNGQPRQIILMDINSLLMVIHCCRHRVCPTLLLRIKCRMHPVRLTLPV
jgi:hypothetical protein